MPMQGQRQLGASCKASPMPFKNITLHDPSHMKSGRRPSITMYVQTQTCPRM